MRRDIATPSFGATMLSVLLFPTLPGALLSLSEYRSFSSGSQVTQSP